MKIDDFAKAIEDFGFHVEKTVNIERGIRIFLRENFYIDVIGDNSEWILYYIRKIDCRNIELVREKIKKRNQEILSKGYITGICFYSSSCNIVVVKKLNIEKNDKLWNEYLNMIKIADLVV